MGLDASIPLGIKPIQFDSPVNTLAKVYQLRSAQNQNALNDIQLQQAMAAQQEQGAVRNAFAQNKDYSSPEFQQQLLSISPETGLKFQKSQLENETAASKLAIERASMYRDALSLVNDPESARQWLSAQYSDTHLGPVLNRISPPEQAFKAIPADPSAFNSWKQQAALGIGKYIELNKPQLVTQNLGNRSQTTAYPGLGGPGQVVSQSAIGISPDSMLSAQTARRGQDISHADAQARLQREMASGQLSLETADYLANLYNRTLVPPVLGSGLAGAAMRKQVYDRARILAESGGVSSGDAADAAINRAIDTKAQQRAVIAFGPAGITGRQINFTNNAIGHLENFKDSVHALNSTNVQVANRAKNFIQKEFGIADPTNVNAVKNFLRTEIPKALIASGGSIKDREEFDKTLNGANSIPQALGVVAEYQKLLATQLLNAKQQYEESTKRKDFDKKLSPQTKKVLGSTVHQNPNGAPKGKFLGFE